MRILSVLLNPVGSVENRGIMDSLGSSVGTLTGVAQQFVPPELRGALGTLGNIAKTEQNKKLGIVELLMDGSDYPWMCLCDPSTANIGKKECPGVPGMGCVMGDITSPATNTSKPAR